MMIENLNITDIANEYAKNNALESFSHIIASAYAAGYKKGFTDCEKGLAKPHEVDYVDLPYTRKSCHFGSKERSDNEAQDKDRTCVQ